MNDHWGAFINKELNLNPKASGKFNGISFAVKDVFEIKNIRNSAGNPDWLKTHPPGAQNAPVIDELLKNGASLTGTTHTDELMYSLNGENYHYGTPINPRGADRIPGGSSSGSAVAVAARLVDFALGTDTGGSVRIPSSYCGIYGIRPTHGLVNIEGVIPLAKSFDTVGWMARDTKLLLEVGELLIPNEDSLEDTVFSQLFFETAAWSLVEGDTKDRLWKAFDLLKESNLNKHYIKAAENGLSAWAELFRRIQGIEIWKEHGAWIQEVAPKFGPGIAERFQWASTLDSNEYESLILEKTNIKNQLSHLLGENGLLVIPTAPGEAPLRNLSVKEMERYRSKTMELTCMAGLTGFPQVTIPIEAANGLPIGLSFIANEKQDLKLLKWVTRYVELLENR
ncbi:amidase [Neobacillus muris]|uniref:amidase n=1 Tax=Neobacillus muris TaxID=2941334 RepID=UPI00203C3663|nr:amidase [Neobacillus muris]